MRTTSPRRIRRLGYQRFVGRPLVLSVYCQVDRCMRLSHLLLTIVLEWLLAMPLAWLLGLTGVSVSFDTRVYISIIPAMVLAIMVAWPFARLLRIPPLMIFSGPCPACGQRPPGWRVSAITTDLWQLRCGKCGARVRLRQTPWGLASDTSSDVPTYVLRWPQFLGVWRRIDSAAPVLR